MREQLEQGLRKLFGVVDVFIILTVLMVLFLCVRVFVCVKTYQVIHFKYVQFIKCQLYINKAIKNYLG